MCLLPAATWQQNPSSSAVMDMLSLCSVDQALICLAASAPCLYGGADLALMQVGCLGGTFQA